MDIFNIQKMNIFQNIFFGPECQYPTKITIKTYIFSPNPVTIIVLNNKEVDCNFHTCVFNLSLKIVRYILPCKSKKRSFILAGPDRQDRPFLAGPGNLSPVFLIRLPSLTRV
jgi:hypothetical protein